MHGRVYPMTFFALDFRTVSIFHRQSRYDAKTLSFSAVEAAFTHEKTPFDVFKLLLTHMVHNVLAFESFIMLSHVSKLLCDQLLMILQV